MKIAERREVFCLDDPARPDIEGVNLYAMVVDGDRACVVSMRCASVDAAKNVTDDIILQKAAEHFARS